MRCGIGKSHGRFIDFGIAMGYVIPPLLRTSVPSVRLYRLLLIWVQGGMAFAWDKVEVGELLSSKVAIQRQNVD